MPICGEYAPKYHLKYDIGTMNKILVLHGPNLNLLGQREPEHYGQDTLASINKRLISQASDDGFSLECFQSNAEHVLVERIQSAAAASVNFIIINPAAFTHTSVAIRDALVATAIPFIEVHLSNVYKREAFRHESYFSDCAVGVLAGLGPQVYELAYQAAVRQLSLVD